MHNRSSYQDPFLNVALYHETCCDVASIELLFYTCHIAILLFYFPVSCSLKAEPTMGTILIVQVQWQVQSKGLGRRTVWATPSAPVILVHVGAVAQMQKGFAEMVGCGD